LLRRTTEEASDHDLATASLRQEEELATASPSSRT
jgi:hypothetical protein